MALTKQQISRRRVMAVSRATLGELVRGIALGIWARVAYPRNRR